jgi:hypothetical protein
MEHLVSCMDTAGAFITAAAAAALAAAAANTSSTTATASAPQPSSNPRQPAVYFANADSCCKSLLQVFQMASCVLCPMGFFTLPAALPAAPAAVRMILAVLQAHGRTQQQQQQLQQVLCARYDARQSGPSGAKASCLFIEEPKIMWALIGALADTDGMLELCPTATQLLQCPEFLSCLTIMAVATTLGLVVSNDSTAAAATPATSSSSGVGSSTGRQVRRAGRQQQQTREAGSGQVGSSEWTSICSGGADAGSSGSGGAGSSGSGLSNGMRLNSLTALSCSLFDILGVTKETALQLAGRVKSVGFTTPEHLLEILRIYNFVIEYQVSQ